MWRLEMGEIEGLLGGLAQYFMKRLWFLREVEKKGEEKKDSEKKIGI